MSRETAAAGAHAVRRPAAACATSPPWPCRADGAVVPGVQVLRLWHGGVVRCCAWV